MQFRWIGWNLDKIAKHGIDRDEAEMVVRNAKPPFPIKIEEEKWLVKGRGKGGRFLQVVYLIDPDETNFVVHARPLTDKEKKQLRRRLK